MSPKKKTPTQMLRKKIWIGICVFLLIVTAVGFWIYRSAVNGPLFYRQSLEIEPNAARRLGEELEDTYLSVHNRMVRESDWSLQVTDQQINGWLAAILAEKYPRFRPTQIDNLRTELVNDRIRIAFRVKDAFIPIVVVIEFQPYVTEDDQNIAIRLNQVSTGVIPLPKKKASEQLTQAFIRARIPIVWTFDDGDPVGLIPSTFDMEKNVRRQWRVTAISIEDGRMTLNGTASDSQ